VNLNFPLVSVIVPNFNYLRYLEKCLESVMSQDYPNIEIIVVDDGSTDESVNYISNLTPKVKLVQQENSGVSVARNRGLLESKGEFIAFLDADDYWDSSKISKQMSLILSTGVDLVYSGVNLVSPDGSAILGAMHPSFKGQCGQYFRRYPSRAVITLGTSNALFRKKLLAKSGLLDPMLSISADWDFFRRICDFAIVDFIEEPLTFYRQHYENMSNYSKSFASDTLRCVKKMVIDDQSQSSKMKKYQLMLKTYLLILKYRLGRS
jgi:glycosyltransferase involved in cell wall biosynthesis